MQPDLTLIGALDGEQLMEDLDTLASFGANDKPGAHRVAYSAADLQGRDWLEGEMKRIGMTVRRDAIGNVIGVYPGTDALLKAIALGSHTDTVPDGGKYDGALGVLSALSIVRALHASGKQLRHPIEIIDFAAEEASLPGAVFGSRAMIGQLTRNVLQQQAWDGSTVENYLKRSGFDPEGVLNSARPVGDVAAYLELHIEQGGRLDREGIPIGIVQGIVGIRRYGVTYIGESNHTGTTPMALRKDALVMAAPFITFVHDIGVKYDIVATVGSAFIEPNAPNVIPGRVDMTIDIRSLDAPTLDKAEKELADFAARTGATFTPIHGGREVLSDPRLMDALREAAAELGLPSIDMPSGAGHDAMSMAKIAPEAMLFVPSKNGISHSPDEFTEAEDCINGARVLFTAVLKLDERLDP